MNKNTIEAFKNCDRASILKKEGETLYVLHLKLKSFIRNKLETEISRKCMSFLFIYHLIFRRYDDITSGLCLDDPSRLVSFVLLSHAVGFPRPNSINYLFIIVLVLGYQKLYFLLLVCIYFIDSASFIRTISSSKNW